MKKILPLLLAVLVSCKKEKDTIPAKKTAVQLLTQKEWILTGAGFDDNNNAALDVTENSIQDCQRDNSFIFNIAGTGAALDNALLCGAPVNNNFNWRFLNNNTELEITPEKLFILRLDENELILNPDIPGLAVKFMMVYKH